MGMLWLANYFWHQRWLCFAKLESCKVVLLSGFRIFFLDMIGLNKPLVLVKRLLYKSKRGRVQHKEKDYAFLVAFTWMMRFLSTASMVKV